MHHYDNNKSFTNSLKAKTNNEKITIRIHLNNSSNKNSSSISDSSNNTALEGDTLSLERDILPSERVSDLNLYIVDKISNNNNNQLDASNDNNQIVCDSSFS